MGQRNRRRGSRPQSGGDAGHNFIFNPGASQETPQGAAFPVLFVVAIYNGYFGAGGGVLVMAGLAICGLHDARRANIFKMLVQVTSNAAAVMVLAWSGIAWPVALGMMPGAIAGGWIGMRIANVMPREILRAHGYGK